MPCCSALYLLHGNKQIELLHVALCVWVIKLLVRNAKSISFCGHPAIVTFLS